jgi:hypothetical protein
MVMVQYKGKIKAYQIYEFENPENAKYCIECGAKLE